MMYRITKALSKLHEGVCSGFFKLRFRCNRQIKFGKSLKCYGLPKLNLFAGSTIFFGNGVVLRNSQFSNSIGVALPCVFSLSSSKASLVIKDNVGMSGVSINCRSSVIIHDRACLGSGAIILDNDCHPLNPVDRSNESIESIKSAPVEIGEDAFIGARAIILRGVKIGARTIVQAGSVVNAGEYPSDVIVAGNPAVVVSQKIN